MNCHAHCTRKTLHIASVIALVQLAACNVADGTLARGKADGASRADSPGSAAASRWTVELRRVWAGPEVADFGGSPSPDGRYLVFTDWSTGELTVRDLGRGENRDLTDKGTWLDSEEFAMLSTFSPDGRRIAYGWFDADRRRFELRKIGTDGSGESTLYRSDSVDLILPLDWSPDGRWIAASLTRADRSNHLVLVAAETGELRVLESYGWRYAQRMAFSPDGRHVAYDLPAGDAEQARDVFVIAVDGTRSSRLIESPGEDRVLGWSPDGGAVLVVSERAGSGGVWRVPVQNGQRAGEPELLRADVWRAVPVGAAGNRYFYGVEVKQRQVYTVQLDGAGGVAARTPDPLDASTPGVSTAPAWSPDGAWLAYISQPSQLPRIVLRSMDSGEAREIALPVEYANRLVWAPDGRSLLFDGRLRGRQALLRLDLRTGGVEAIRYAPPRSGSVEPTPSPDGRRLYFRGSSPDDAHGGIVARELETGAERTLYRAESRSVEDRLESIALSPDGRTLAFVAGTRLFAMPSTGGTPRELHRVTSPVWISRPAGLAWTPDGTSVLFVTGDGPGNEGTELWRVALDGDAPEHVLTFDEGIEHIDIHPDGRRLAFASAEYEGELWVMEIAEARDAAASASPDAIMRRVWAGPDAGNGYMGRPSPDGRYLSLVDWSTGDLAVRDLARGENRRLTDDGTWIGAAEYAGFSTFSPDGEHIAYAWYNADGRYDLRIIGLDGSGGRTVYRSSDDVQYIWPHEWSPDGERILVVLEHADGSTRIALVSVADGSTRTVPALDWQFPKNIGFSPDGRFIGFDLIPERGAPHSDIHVLTVDGRRQTRITNGPGHKSYLGWSGDGASVYFARDDGGPASVWRVPVHDGRRAGEPRLVRDGLWRMLPLDMSRDAIFYGVSLEMPRVHTAVIDLERGRVLSPRVAVSDAVRGRASGPAWSADGSLLAYYQHPILSVGPYHPTVVIRSVATGETRELPAGIDIANILAWSADGTALFSAGRARNRQGIYRIDLETAQSTPVVLADGARLLAPEVAADGRTLYFIRSDRDGDTGGIIVRDLVTGAERFVHRQPDHLRNLALSPDGARLAFETADPTSGVHRFMLVPVGGGEPRAFHESATAAYPGVVWTPDGSALLVVRPEENADSASLWQVPVDGSAPHRLLTMPGMMYPRVHPDGRRIAFAAGAWRDEIWVLEYLDTLQADVRLGQDGLLPSPRF